MSHSQHGAAQACRSKRLLKRFDSGVAAAGIEIKPTKPLLARISYDFPKQQVYRSAGKVLLQTGSVPIHDVPFRVKTQSAGYDRVGACRHPKPDIGGPPAMNLFK